MPKRKSSIGRLTPRAKRQRAALDQESTQDRRNRLEHNRVTKRQARDDESQEERENRLQCKRIATREARNAETQEERADRVQRSRIAAFASREAETNEQRVHRLQEDRIRHAQRRRVGAGVNDFHWENAAFEYNANIAYECPIGEMSFVCQHCEARKWQLEAPGMCCLNAVPDVKMRTSADSTADDALPLYGIPVSVSELIELQEKDRTLGLGGLVGIPAKSDAHVVKLLKSLGAVPFIRTNVTQAHPFCFSIASSNPIFGHTSNPVDSYRSAGGGSCGEACALALKSSVLGVGADVVGGVRIPAHFCGVAALRTTAQRLSTQGLMQSQSQVPTCVGPMAREVAGLVAFMRGVCGSQQTEVDPTLPEKPFDEKLFSSTKPLRIGYYIEDGYTKTTPAVSRAVVEAKKYLERKGHKLVPFTPPDMCHMMSELLYPAAMGSNSILWDLLSVDVVDPSIRRIYYRIQVNNALRWIFSWWNSAVSPMEAALERSQLPLTLDHWWHLRNAIQEFRRDFSLGWRNRDLDVLICPVMPCAAVNLGNETRFLACLTHVGLFSLVNFPAGTVPVTQVQPRDLGQFHSSSYYLPKTSLDHLIMQDQMGDEKDPDSSVLGLPVGVQVAAPPFHEETVLRVMRDLEQAAQRASFASSTSSGSFRTGSQGTSSSPPPGKPRGGTGRGGESGGKLSRELSDVSMTSESTLISDIGANKQAGVERRDWRSSAGRDSDTVTNREASGERRASRASARRESDSEDNQSPPALTVSVTRVKSALRKSVSKVGSAISRSVSRVGSVIRGSGSDGESREKNFDGNGESASQEHSAGIHPPEPGMSREQKDLEPEVSNGDRASVVRKSDITTGRASGKSDSHAESGSRESGGHVGSSNSTYSGSTASNDTKESTQRRSVLKSKPSPRDSIVQENAEVDANDGTTPTESALISASESRGSATTVGPTQRRSEAHAQGTPAVVKRSRAKANPGSEEGKANRAGGGIASDKTSGSVDDGKGQKVVVDITFRDD